MPDRNQAEAMFEALRAAAGPGEGYDDYMVEVKTYNDRNYYVLLSFKGKSGALEPDLAREVVRELLIAANVAEEKNPTDE
jgi:hypothetical protein